MIAKDRQKVNFSEGVLPCNLGGNSEGENV